MPIIRLQSRKCDFFAIFIDELNIFIYKIPIKIAHSNNYYYFCDVQNCALFERNKNNNDMKHFFRLAAACAALFTAVGATSCTDAEQNDNSGILRVKLAVDATATTRAEQTLTAPEISDFDLSITSADESYSNHWESLSDLTSETRFEVGEYNLAATCGDITNEAFDAPCFGATSSCRILPNQTTLVNMTATLANCGVRVTQSEAFLKYFSDWTISLVSAAGTTIPFVEGEERTAYIAPAKFKIKVTFTKPNGTTGSRTIKVSDVQPRTIYTVRMDVNEGEVGESQIVIRFDDSVTTENIEIEIDEQ